MRRTIIIPINKIGLSYILVSVLVVAMTGVLVAYHTSALWRAELIKYQLGKYVVDAKTEKCRFVLIVEDKTSVEDSK